MAAAHAGGSTAYECAVSDTSLDRGDEQGDNGGGAGGSMEQMSTEAMMEVLKKLNETIAE